MLLRDGRLRSSFRFSKAENQYLGAFLANRDVPGDDPRDAVAESP